MINKCFGIFLISFLFYATSFAQNFEGKLVYQSVYTSKIPNVSNEQLGLMMGNKYEYFIKGGSYKTSTNGTFFQWQIYVRNDNKLYNKMASAEELLWNDVTVATDEVVKSEINKNAVTILGYPCDEVILTCKKSVEKYYYHAALKVDASLFTNHKFGNWSEFTKLSNALPLKLILDNAQFVLEATATEILPMKLDDKLFELPAGAKTAKSPF